MKRSFLAVAGAVFAAGIVLSPPTVAAKTNSCKISVVGGSHKGSTFKLKIRNGKVIGTRSQASPLRGCLAMKNIYNRWYHLCSGGKIIVYRWLEDRRKWKRLSAKNLRKYRHNCF